MGYNRGQAPQNAAQLPTYVRKELEKIQRAFGALSTDWTALTGIPANVVSLAALLGAADELPYFTGVGALALASLTPYARTILACANAAAARTALGLGALAVLANVTEATIVLADVTTEDVSTVRHGFAPKAPNDATKYLDGTGAYSVPAGGGTAPAFPSIANLELRFSAKFSAVTLSSDGRVTNVSDVSGNGRNSDTMTGAARPMWFQTVFNGQPCFGFDGASTPMHLGVTLGLTIAAPLTVVLVMMNYLGGTPTQHLYRDTSGGALGFNNTGTSWSMFNGSTVSSSALYTQSITPPLPPGRTTHAVVRIDQFDGTSSICANNGVEVAIGNPGTSAGGIHSAFLVGSGFDTGAADQAARMFLHDFLIFSRALTLTERNALRTYYANPLIAGVDLV